MLKTFLLLALSPALIFISCNNQANNDQPLIQNEETQLKSRVDKFPDSLLLRENLIQYYRDNNNYNKAQDVTDAALKKDSLNARLWDIKGTLYFETSDTLNAIKSFEKAVSLNPEPEYIMTLSSLYAQTKNPLALTMADALIKDPKSDEQKQSLFIKGLYYSSTGDNIKAIGYFDTCISIDYTFTFAYREKAICLYNMGKYNDALDILSKALAVENTFDEAYYWMGRCNEKLGNKDEAVKNYQAALQIDKNYIEAKNALTRLGTQ
jgi:tetratricopeptide (TPR) repeat protein